VGRAVVIARIGGSLGVVLLVSVLYTEVILVNPTTVSLTYLVLILLIASRWGIAESTTASIAAVLCFNFFFLPPVRTFAIADPQNWVALLAFLLTAVVTSQLSGRARQRHLEGSHGRAISSGCTRSAGHFSSPNVERRRRAV
jgi:two-component system sensor histidine kinase KdpD